MQNALSPYVMLAGGMVAGLLIGFGLGILYHRSMMHDITRFVQENPKFFVNAIYGKLGLQVPTLKIPTSSMYGRFPLMRRIRRWWFLRKFRGSRYEETKLGALVTTDIRSEYPSGLVAGAKLRSEFGSHLGSAGFCEGRSTVDGWRCCLPVGHAGQHRTAGGYSFGEKA